MMRGSRGFTLMELLAVVAIAASVMGLIVSTFPRRDRRLQEVKTAAEELAATFRQARAFALSRNAAYAVVFHIENAPTSSGRVLNNRTGGHWYRILGPAGSKGSAQSRDTYAYDRIDGLPPVIGSIWKTCITSSPFNLTQMTQVLATGWAGEQHTLAAGRVRFLALTDMDYGDFTSNGSRRMPSGTVSYPRPWFGWWDKADAAGGGAGRLYPWGGFDAAIPGSGFYYWGSSSAGSLAPLDPPPVGCTNPVARALDRWVDGQQTVRSNSSVTAELPAHPGADVLYEAGSPRPLINGTWRDMSILFAPTGEVFWGGTLPGRRTSYYWNNVVLGTPVFRGAAERCNGIFETQGMVNQHTQAESGNFEQSSGGFHITLGPDAATDADVFPSARAALESMMPAFRVFVSSFGDIRVIQVGATERNTGGRRPFPTAEGWYRSGSNMRLHFGRDRLVQGNVVDPGGTGIGDPEPGGPITDFLTPDMLTNRSVWLK